MIKITGKLKHGLKIGPDTHLDFEMRPHLAGDMFDAEGVAHPGSQPMTYNAALAGLKVVRLGTLSGPIELAELRKLHPEDVKILVEKSEEVQRAGKPE
ncbi:hypothetical protein D9M68_483790 [compost metagenome]